MGCLLAALRGLAGLVPGGAVGRFLADVAAFGLAAVLLCGFAAGASAAATPRWYMALGMGVGALCWQMAIHRALRRAAGRALHWLGAPWRLFVRHVVQPFGRQMRQKIGAIRHKVYKNSTKRPKTAKKRLQKPTKVLYN